MLTIDTSVLMYASGNEHPLRDSCRRLIALVTAQKLSAVTTPETIREFAHIYARRRNRTAATAQALEYAQLLAPLRVSGPEHLETGLRLWEENDQLSAFDSILAAVALDTEYATVVSADRAFATIPGITHVYPDEAGIASLIEA